MEPLKARSKFGKKNKEKETSYHNSVLEHITDTFGYAINLDSILPPHPAPLP